LEQIFRSRGIKVSMRKDEANKIKIYYEPNQEIIPFDSGIISLAERFTCLEYAVSAGKVDAVNFHTNCESIDDITTSFNCEMINVIGNVFDPSYRAYTIGYRMNGGKSIYYYPTVWKDTRFGLCGITDKKIITDQITRFLSFIYATDECRYWIFSQIPYMTKFKGLCITNFQNTNSYKLYYRLTSTGIRVLFETSCEIEKYCNEYGEVVLVSSSIMNGQIEAYNLYFLR
jgi:hypothetical protein